MTEAHIKKAKLSDKPLVNQDSPLCDQGILESTGPLDKHSSLVEEIPALVCRFLPDGTLTYANKAYCQYFGKGKSELEGANIYQFIPQEVHGELKSKYANFTPQSPESIVEHQVIDARGEPKWQRWFDRAIFDETGKVIEFHSVGQDITGWKQAQDTLKNRSIKLSLLSDFTIQYLDFSFAQVDYTLLADHLRELASAAGAFICRYDETKEEINLKGISYPGYSRDKINRLLDFDIRTEKWKVSEKAQENMRTARVIKLGSLCDLTYGMMSQKFFHYIKEAFYDSNTYIIGFAYQKKILGTAVIIMPPGKELDDADILELFSRNVVSVFFRKESELRLEAQLEILAMLAKSDDYHWSIQMALCKILEVTGIQVGAIRLITGEDYFFTSGEDIPDSLVQDSIGLLKNYRGELQEEIKGGRLSLTCSCGNTYQGSVESRYSIYNYYGSFFTGHRSLWVQEGQEKKQAVTQPGEECALSNYETLALIPIKAGKAHLGLLQLYDERNNGLSLGDIAFLESIAQPIGYVLLHLQDYKLLQSLSARLINAQEEERSRLARDLHDEIGQTLTAVKLDLQMLGDELREEKNLPTGRLEGSIKLVDRTLEFVRSQAASLRPPVLDELGLVAAVNNMVEDLNRLTGIQVRVKAPEKVPRLSGEKEAGLYRCIQESLTNVARHANASQAQVILEIKGRRLIIKVSDNGKGFDPGDHRLVEKYMGLGGMRERVKLLGGKW